MDIDIESEITKVIDIEMKGLSVLREQINSNYYIFPAKYDVVKSIASVESVASFLIYFQKN
ncbi:MAG: hypothetical protein GY777_07945 [Candidatus Brocadiaceae bacterium]|nr:hypothetical protein [Candidatus Brocadiaceae bacterium]